MTEKDFVPDQKVFDQLPEKTKAMAVLQEDAEKTIGPDHVKVQEKIQRKAQDDSDPPTPPPPK